MSCSINKLKSHKLFSCQNFMFSIFTWKEFSAPRNGEWAGATHPCPPPPHHFSTALGFELSFFLKVQKVVILTNCGFPLNQSCLFECLVYNAVVSSVKCSNLMHFLQRKWKLLKTIAMRLFSLCLTYFQKGIM